MLVLGVVTLLDSATLDLLRLSASQPLACLDPTYGWKLVLQLTGLWQGDMLQLSARSHLWSITIIKVGCTDFFLCIFFFFFPQFFRLLKNKTVANISWGIIPTPSQPEIWLYIFLLLIPYMFSFHPITAGSCVFQKAAVETEQKRDDAALHAEVERISWSTSRNMWDHTHKTE